VSSRVDEEEVAGQKVIGRLTVVGWFLQFTDTTAGAAPPPHRDTSGRSVRTRLSQVAKRLIIGVSYSNMRQSVIFTHSLNRTAVLDVRRSLVELQSDSVPWKQERGL